MWNANLTQESPESPVGILALNNIFELWECLIIGLLAIDLVITLYGLGSEIPDAVLPEAHAESVAVIAFTELILLMQLLQILLPTYPTSEFESLARSRKLSERTLCKWIGGLFGTQGAEFAASTPKLEANELRTFGFFLIPVAAAVGWKWRRLRRRLRRAGREDEAALIARVFRVWAARN
ncbi:hypothetical protein CkaCkLH20_05217 [Colletotrichum karsti]|uniref:Uncharacterized protein n=1 Tax=Colletotrichum karsti TaxID=1095194 RepID=A0A9P6LMH4_9PEZI|nr:uncharacterized protein CkaCkLH20_05217 [Colletotrichum karsti]KAF9877517.1 hypothetical protein CkaCkLH20_05217 [Colletotrichum karsti]